MFKQNRWLIFVFFVDNNLISFKTSIMFILNDKVPLKQVFKFLIYMTSFKYWMSTYNLSDLCKLTAVWMKVVNCWLYALLCFCHFNSSIYNPYLQIDFYHVFIEHDFSEFILWNNFIKIYINCIIFVNMTFWLQYDIG